MVVDEESAILGFQGNKQSVMADGEAAIALLEANQFNQFTNTIAPYYLKNGRLLLKGLPVTRKSIGLRLRPPNNACLKKNRVVYISDQDIQAIRKAGSSAQRSAKLEATLNKRKSYDPFREALHLRIDKDILISLNYRDGSVMRTRAMHSKFSRKTVCLISELEL